MGKEVITLQFGNFANYVGAHYWNFQDELLGLQEEQDPHSPAAQIDSSVLYRQGETLHGEGTYTPRLVMWDLSGALGGVPAGGYLYRDHDHSAAVAATWAGRQEVHRAAPVAKSRFAAELESEVEEPEDEEREAAAVDGAAAALSSLQVAAQQLDSGGSGEGGTGVRYFTDFLKAHLHPRSVHQLAGAWHGLTPFGSWGDGGEHWRSEEQREDMMERIRFFAEESDHLQGFQVLAADLSGWGQLAAHVLQEVRDEYGGGRPVMLYALRPEPPPASEAPPAEQRRWQLNEGLSLALLAPRCNAYTVLSPGAAAGRLPLLRWHASNAYHASAVCAAALDTATLPYRLSAGSGPNAAIGQTDMWGLSQLLTAQHSSPLAALSVALPCPAVSADQQQLAHDADTRMQHGAAGPGGGGSGGSSSTGSPFTTRGLASLTPGVAGAGDAGRYAESVVLRGPRSASSALELGAAAAALDAALGQERHRCVRHRTLAAQPLAVPLPFPHIFARGLSTTGDLPAGGRLGAGTQDLASCAVLTRLGASAAFGGVAAAARQRFVATAGSVQGQANLESWGLGKEELQGIQEQLAQLANVYAQED